MRRTYFGFTIIELVVVIILLGILAATALPRFVNVDTEAHAAVVKGVHGGMQTGISLYHAQWVAQQQPGPNTQIAEFNNLRTNADGFPYGTANRTATGGNVTTSADCVSIFNGVLHAGAPTISSVAAVENVIGSNTDFTAVVDGVNCSYYYTAENNDAGSVVRLLLYTSTTGLLDTTTATL